MKHIFEFVILTKIIVNNGRTKQYRRILQVINSNNNNNKYSTDDVTFKQD